MTFATLLDDAQLGDFACKQSGVMLLSGRVDDRFETVFGGIGTVIDLFGPKKPTLNASMFLGDDATPIGVVSFVDTPTSLQIATEYQDKSSTAAALVVVCDGTHPCPSSCNTDSCITTASIITVDTYRITKMLECPDQPHGFPVTYRNVAGARECVCQCEPGWRRSTSGLCDVQVGGSTTACSWSQPTNPFLIRNSAQLATCSFSGIASNGVTVPVAIDNYVGKGRTNPSKPHIELKTARISDQPIVSINSAAEFPVEYPALYSPLTTMQKQGVMVETDDTSGATSPPQTFTWLDYQSSRLDKINSLAYSSYGKYAIELDAKDYRGTATCQGCLSIVDDFRPTATVSCMTGMSSDLEPTVANIQTINTKIESYFAFKDTGVLNDACSSPRCDEVHVQMQSMSSSSYTDSTNDHSVQAAQTYFSQGAIRSEVLALGEIPDTELVTDSLTTYQCKRCLKMTTALKEWWIDYSCTRDYAVKKCEGNSLQTCTFEQCNVLSGSTISAAAVSIKPSVQTDSQNVLNLIEGKLSFNTIDQVHVALSQCKQFASPGAEPSAECVYSVSISDLFVPASPDAGVLSFTANELASAVKWRFKIGTSSWGVWSDSLPTYDFKQAVTSVVFEAWTKCGRVYSHELKVHLHISAPSHVCDFFPNMWYQTVHVPDTPAGSFCMYPKADFAEVTFDYEANIGIVYAKDKLNMNIKEVECRLKYSWLPSSSIAASVISSTTPSESILERFAILGKREPITAESTEFDVECDFKYEVFGSSDLYEQTCSHSYSIVDCTDPKVDEPSAVNDKSCAVDSCASTSEPSAYEACGGNIISMVDDNTVFSNGDDQTCCQFCSPTYVTSCKRLPQLTNDDIKLCIPSSNMPAADDYDDGPNLLMAAAERIDNMVSVPTVTMVAGAMIAVVALVVVRRRRRVAESVADNDVYYALLN